MVRFNAYDKNGTPCQVEEYGNDIGLVITSKRAYQAVRLASSTYMGTDGQIYAANRNNCFTYMTPEWVGWARRKMYSVGYLPEF